MNTYSGKEKNFFLVKLCFVKLSLPCHQNRGKIDDFIAIFSPINCALYRDSSRFRQKPVVNRDLIDDFFLENRDKIVRTDDFFEDENIITKSDRILIK